MARAASLSAREANRLIEIRDQAWTRHAKLTPKTTERLVERGLLERSGNAVSITDAGRELLRLAGI